MATIGRRRTQLWLLTGVVTAIGLAAAVVFLRPDNPVGPGRLVTAAGVTQYVDCDGERGSNEPAVILIGGLGASALDAWGDVQPAVSQLTEVCSLDRPGVGMSPTRDVRANGPVENGHETLAALQAANVAPPYILVGWSYGGLVALTAAAEAISQTTADTPSIAGVVLVDSSLPDEYRTVDKHGWREGGRRLDMAAAEPVIANLRLSNIPVVVLLPEDSPWDEDTEPAMVSGATELAEKSADYVVAKVPDSGHFIAGDNPQAVIAAIADVLAAAPPGVELPDCPANFVQLRLQCIAADGGK